MNEFDLLQFRGNLIAERILLFPCNQKILMVTDGSLNFGTGGFGLSEFRNLIQSAGHAVDTAHRTGAGANLTISGTFNFATASKSVTRRNYDQLWLFGFSTAALGANEQQTIAQFMQEGGGVFATGDHSAIGAGMGANIPRVRRMRNWATIPMANPQRLDTVLEPGADGVKRFQNQADAIPQRIYPVFFSNGGPDNQQSTWNVHPVLRHPSGAVDYLPDHPHESECLAPNPTAGNFAGVVEWPTPVGGGSRIPPNVVALSISAGRFITDIIKPPVMPRCFGAISVYDGDAANVGRIVCDATWHHFVNINLNGAGAGIDPATGQPYPGLYHNGQPTPEYLKIRRYFHNTVRWLAPKGRRICWPFLQLALVRFDLEVAELLLPRPQPDFAQLLEIGRIAHEAADRHWGPGTFEDLIAETVAESGVAAPLMDALRAQQFPEGEARRSAAAPDLLPIQELRWAVAGAVVNELATQLPEDEDEVERRLKALGDVCAKPIAAAARHAVTEFAAQMDRRLRSTSRFIRTLGGEVSARTSEGDASAAS